MPSSEAIPLPSWAPVVIIGAGQAGLAMAACLKRRGIQALVLEKNRIGHAWQHQRWDSFCLVTPNWQCRLPDFPYDGDDPDGFMVRDAIVDYVRRFAAHREVDVREGVSVQGLQRQGDGYRLSTSAGTVDADQVVVAIGGYHHPKRHPCLLYTSPSPRDS